MKPIEALEVCRNFPLTFCIFYLLTIVIYWRDLPGSLSISTEKLLTLTRQTKQLCLALKLSWKMLILCMSIVCEMDYWLGEGWSQLLMSISFTFLNLPRSLYFNVGFC
jgi:hypothetical protein